MSRRISALLFDWIATSAGACVAFSVPVHPPPPAVAEFEVSDTSVTIRLTAWQDRWQTWLGRPVEVNELAAEPAARAQFATEVAAWFQREDLLRIDEQPPTIQPGAVDTPDAIEQSHGYPIVAVTVQATLLAPARSATLLWRDFRGLEDPIRERVQLPVILVLGDTLRPIALRPEEPQYTWHSFDQVPRRTEVPIEAVGDGPRGLRLPWFSIAFGVLAMVVGVARPFHWQRRTAWSVCGASVLLALALTPIRTEIPLGTRKVETPELLDSLQIFETLLGNVYRSFEARDEEEIYDTLATAVSAELVDRLYGEIYESLILREDGGAVCSVEHIEILECYRLSDESSTPQNPPPGTTATPGPSFRIDATWRVQGQVLHFGHLHQRTNRYRAVFRIRHDGRSWKIAEQIPLESFTESTND